jgi:hypothetical protein
MYSNKLIYRILAYFGFIGYCIAAKAEDLFIISTDLFKEDIEPEVSILRPSKTNYEIMLAGHRSHRSHSSHRSRSHRSHYSSSTSYYPSTSSLSSNISVEAKEVVTPSYIDLKASPILNESEKELAIVTEVMQQYLKSYHDVLRNWHKRKLAIYKSPSRRFELMEEIEGQLNQFLELYKGTMSSDKYYKRAAKLRGDVQDEVINLTPAEGFVVKYLDAGELEMSESTQIVLGEEDMVVPEECKFIRVLGSFEVDADGVFVFEATGNILQFNVADKDQPALAQKYFVSLSKGSNLFDIKLPHSSAVPLKFDDVIKVKYYESQLK